MLRRCYDENYKDYERYGDKGIKVSKSWKNSFETFHSDMGNRPSKKHSLDRINNKKGYSKNNCRWATYKEQNNNRTSNRIIEYEGQTKTAIQWAEFLNIPYRGMLFRLNKGETLKDIIAKPSRPMGKAIFIKVNGKKTKLITYCKDKNLNYDAISKRIKAGWGAKRAFTQPFRGS